MLITKGKDGRNYCLFFSEKGSNGYCSNWFLSNFIVDGINYNCVEQYMMYQKAKLFGDAVIAKKILETSSQKEIKALGRKVKNFDGGVWDKHKQEIVNNGVYEKFRQCKPLQDEFLSKRVDEFVECSPYDGIWGIKTALSDKEACTTPALWRGENRLGIALLEAYKKLLKEKR